MAKSKKGLPKGVGIRIRIENKYYELSKNEFHSKSGKFNTPLDISSTDTENYFCINKLMWKEHTVIDLKLFLKIIDSEGNEFELNCSNNITALPSATSNLKVEEGWLIKPKEKVRITLQHSKTGQQELNYTLRYMWLDPEKLKEEK